ncbi:Uncharacterised protein [Mycobacterium tuberculosis]|nr:Uncharacterised protein [Mycobacterium tuberculosis]
MVMDSLGVTGLAVQQAISHSTPPGSRLLGWRRDGQYVLNADRAHHISQHPRRRPFEVDPFGQRFEQFVRIAGTYSVCL